MLAGRDGREASDWRLMGVVCGRRDVDPKINSTEEWCAWARSSDGERIDGRANSPEDALLQLATKLKESSR